MKDKKLIEMFYSPGYSDMRGAFHREELAKGGDGEWVVTCRDREHFGAPEVVTVYAVEPDAFGRFEGFMKKRRIARLSRRIKSRAFVTDYSPWEFLIVFEDPAVENGESDDYSIKEHRLYTLGDRLFIKEMLTLFHALRGPVISKTEEKPE